MWRDVVVDIFLPYDDEQHSPREMGSMNLSRARIFARRAKEPSGIGVVRHRTERS